MDAVIMDANRERFLRDRVLTATPAQRVVMLYDRLALDLTRARTETDPALVTRHIDHAFRIVTELMCSLDESAGGPAANLSQIYGFLLHELVEAQLHGAGSLDTVVDIVGSLRVAWSTIAEGTVAATASLGTGWTA